MALNLLKLCVGCDSVEDLEEWIAFRLDERRRAGEPAEHFHTTRMVPTRGAELARRRFALLGHQGAGAVPPAARSRSGRSSMAKAFRAAIWCSIPRWCAPTGSRAAPSRAGAISSRPMRRPISAGRATTWPRCRRNCAANWPNWAALTLAARTRNFRPGCRSQPRCCNGQDLQADRQRHMFTVMSDKHKPARIDAIRDKAEPHALRLGDIDAFVRQARAHGRGAGRPAADA